jgi:hypothetical protein
MSSRKRLDQIATELKGLCTALEAISERALPLVEEIENWKLENNCKFTWTPEVKEMFRTMQRLITRV